MPGTDRERAILSAALVAFGRYGFARTTMDDIAKASGVARTALYKTFRNKEDIFRALASSVHDEALRLARDEIKKPGPFGARLEAALIAWNVHLLEVGHSGPHAEEIAGLYQTLAADLASRANQTLTAEMTKSVNAAIRGGDFSLREGYASAKDFAHLLRLALEGVKLEVKSPPDFARLASQLLKAMI